MNRRSLLATAALVPLAAACDRDTTAPKGKLRIATGSQAAVYYAYGKAIAQLVHDRLPDVDASVLVTAASAENVDKVLSGDAEVGFTQADIAGERAGRSPGRLPSIARLYDDYIHLVVRNTSGITKLAELRGHNVSLGAAGSGTAITAARLLSVEPTGVLAGLTRFELGLDDSAEAMRKNGIDAFFFSGGLPVGAIDELAKTTGVQLIDLHELVDPLRKKFGNYYEERVVPGQTYTGIKATATIGIANYLVVSAAMSTAMARALTEVLFDGRDALARAHPAGARLNTRSAISTPPLHLHPGAAAYYRDVKE